MKQETCQSRSQIQKVAKITDASARYIWVDVKREAACNHCQSQSSCGISLMEKLFGERKTQLKIENQTGSIAGEEILLSIDETALVKAALLAYLIPLIFMAAGTALLQSYGNLFAILGAGTGLLGGLLLSRFVTQGRLARHFIPRVSPNCSTENTQRSNPK